MTTATIDLETLEAAITDQVKTVEFYYRELQRATEAQLQAERLLYAEQRAGDPAGLVVDLVRECRKLQRSTLQARDNYYQAYNLLKGLDRMKQEATQ